MMYLCFIYSGVKIYTWDSYNCIFGAEGLDTLLLVPHKPTLG